MRRTVLGLILLFVVPSAAVAQNDTLTAKPLLPPPPHAGQLSSAAPADSMKEDDLYLVNGRELSHIEEKAPHLDASVTWIELPGPSSGLEALDPQPHFRIATEPERVGALRLVPLEVKSGKRRARIDANKMPDVLKNKLPVVVKETGSGLFDLAPKKPLKSGEYAIGRLMGQGIVLLAGFTIPESAK